MLFLVRHAESIENATKYTGFYENPPFHGPSRPRMPCPGTLSA